MCKGVASIRRAENGAPFSQDPPRVPGRELACFCRRQKPLEPVNDARDLPTVLEDGGLRYRANDSVEPRGITAARQNTDTHKNLQIYNSNEFVVRGSE